MARNRQLPFLAALGGVLALGLLSACGSDGVSNKPNAVEPAASNQTASSSPQDRKDADGTDVRSSAFQRKSDTNPKPTSPASTSSTPTATPKPSSSASATPTPKPSSQSSSSAKMPSLAVLEDQDSFRYVYVKEL